jgi:hypothetical protein
MTLLEELMEMMELKEKKNKLKNKKEKKNKPKNKDGITTLIFAIAWLAIFFLLF